MWFQETFSITPEHMESFLDALENSGKMYIFQTLVYLDRQEIVGIHEDFKKIARAAQNLKDLLPAKDSRAFALLVMIDQLEKKQNLEFDEKTNAAYQMYTIAEKVTDELIRLPKVLPESGIGQFLKIGTKSAKGNMSLRLWVDHLYHIWIDKLSRDFKFDGKLGVNGRKRFTNLTYETLAIIHPEIPFGSVENAVTAFLSKKPKSSGL